MKKRKLLMVCLLLLSLCVACGKAEEPNWKPGWNIAEESDRKFTDTVEIKLTELNLSENRVTYEMYNTSKKRYTYGPDDDFKLEILHDGKWHKMRHEPGWDMVAVGDALNPGQTKVYSTSYATSAIAELCPATYRFIKEIQAEGNPQKSLFICCEFVVE